MSGRHTPRRTHRNRGMGLIELMIGLLIGSIIVLGITQLFIGSRRTYAMNEEMARLQENGRFAIGRLQRDIRMAGYQGCRSFASRSGPLMVMATDGKKGGGDGEEENEGEEDGGKGGKSGGSNGSLQASAFANGEHLLGADNYSGTNLFDAGIEPVSGSDAILVRFASGESLRPAEEVKSGKHRIKITDNRLGLGENDTAMITDCINGAIFRIKDIGGSGDEIHLDHKANSPRDFTSNYKETASVMAFRSVVYYLRDSGDKNTDGSSVLTLYRRDLASGAGAEPLVNNVENMQILYGEDTTGDAEVDRYVPADDADMDSVMAVRVALLIASGNTVRETKAQNTYTLGDETVSSADDRRMRQVFSTTISLRNREVLSDEI